MVEITLKRYARYDAHLCKLCKNSSKMQVEGVYFFMRRGIPLFWPNLG